MRCLETPIRKRKKLRAIGFDDAPFDKFSNENVSLAGIVCSGTRFEGMVWGEIEKDGLDATDKILSLLRPSKFREQLNLILTDGVTFGGFNVVDLGRLAEELQIPCIAVMRKPPDLPAFYEAMQRVDRVKERKLLIKNAGPIFSLKGFHFQAIGCTASLAAEALARVTDQGVVPECLRLAHLIGAAIKTGESGKRA